MIKVRSAYEIAQEHKAADKRCGRKWECACGACNSVRKVDAITAEQERKHGKGLSPRGAKL